MQNCPFHESNFILNGDNTIFKIKQGRIGSRVDGGKHTDGNLKQGNQSSSGKIIWDGISALSLFF